MKILITGGLGFLGTNFCYHALAQPELEQLLIIDKFGYAAQICEAEVLQKDPRVMILPGDITSRGCVFKAIQMMRPTHVVHMAAQTHVDRSIADPTPFFETNVMGTLVLLDTIRQYAPDIKLFLHISTDEVYGPTDGPEAQYPESQLHSPRSPYAASKDGAESVCYAYHYTYDLPIQIVRPTNNYGPFQNQEKFIPKIITHALLDLPIPVYGAGEEMRDWMWVGDHMRALWLLLKAGWPMSLNIGSGHHLTNLQVVKNVLSMIPTSKSRVEFVANRKAHDFCYSVSTANIEALYGWKPEVNFRAGLHKTINWYKQRFYETR